VHAALPDRVSAADLSLVTDGIRRIYRLHLLEVRFDPDGFIRLGRGTVANIDAITKVSPMPRGTYLARLSNGDELQVSRIQSRVLRQIPLKL
jgi:DNA-binding LytR/AlgR family response regulator